MADDILDLTNQIVYNGRMKHANPSVASQALILKGPKVIRSQPTWLSKLLEPKRKVVFVEVGRMMERVSEGGLAR